MSYKKYFFALLFFPAVFFSFLAGFVIYSDVLQIFPKGYFIKEKFTGNMRCQNKGIIDNIEFQSVFLGTSMLENSSSIEASEMLGETFVNLSMSGSNFYERSIILNYLLKNKNIDSVIYSFDQCLFDRMYDVRPKGSNWPTLYSGNIYDLLIYYYDMGYIKRSLKNVFIFFNTYAKIDFFDHPAEWAKNPYHSCRFGGLENWVLNIEKQGIREFFTEQLAEVVHAGITIPQYISCDKDKYDKVIKYVDDNIISFTKEYPQTNFYILIPPYYRYRYAEMRQVSGSNYALHQEQIRHIVNMSARYPNLKVYGFEDMPFLDDIINYKDTSHYHDSINSKMTRAIADGEHILTPENIESYLAKCDVLAQNFDIKKFYDDACALMVKHGLDLKTGIRVKGNPPLKSTSEK